MVPKRDGVDLATNIYLPAERSAATYNQRGYALIAQDVRGRYESKGENRPFETDIEDGYDTVEWIAFQQWQNRYFWHLCPRYYLQSGSSVCTGAVEKGHQYHLF